MLLVTQIIFLVTIAGQIYGLRSLSRTNLVVMVDDPVFSTHLGEFIVNLQSGLTMGSITAGVTTPGDSLLLTSNGTVLPR